MSIILVVDAATDYVGAVAGCDAAPQQAKILRLTPGATKRTEVLINLDQISSGKAEDVPLQQDDILFVPDSKQKRAVLRTLEALLTMGTTVGAYTIIR